jgi:hypothetical protein
MPRSRLVIALLTMTALAALMGWQYRRERMVRACVDLGGIWYGQLSACKYQRPVLQRDLQRS